MCSKGVPAHSTCDVRPKPNSISILVSILPTDQFVDQFQDNLWTLVHCCNCNIVTVLPFCHKVQTCSVDKDHSIGSLKATIQMLLQQSIYLQKHIYTLERKPYGLHFAISYSKLIWSLFWYDMPWARFFLVSHLFNPHAPSTSKCLNSLMLMDLRIEDILSCKYLLFFVYSLPPIICSRSLELRV